MRTVTSLEDHTNAILTLLQTSTITIGDGVAPRDDQKNEIDPPYAVLYPIPGGGMDGPLSDSQADVSLLYQITAVGDTRQQCQVILDILRVLMMDRSNLSVPNRVVRDIRHINPNSGVIRDDDLPNPLFYGYDRYEVDTTPTGSGFGDGFDDGFG